MAKPGRNEPCPCGSGKKYKNCHESKTTSSRTSQILMVVVGAAVLAAIAAGSGVLHRRADPDRHACAGAPNTGTITTPTACKSPERLWAQGSRLLGSARLQARGFRL